MKQGTVSVLFGCHSIVHSILVTVSWKILYKRWPKFWQLVCIILHDVGHWGLDYLNNPSEKRIHWCRGARYAFKLYGWRGYNLTSGHCANSIATSALRLPDKHSWTIAPVIWLWWNNVVEPKLVRPGKTKWESAILWKALMKEFVSSGDYRNKSAHDIYLKNMKT